MRARKNTPAANLISDLVAAKLPAMAARVETIRITALKRELDAGRLSLAEVQAQHRGVA